MGYLLALMESRWLWRTLNRMPLFWLNLNTTHSRNNTVKRTPLPQVTLHDHDLLCFTWESKISYPGHEIAWSIYGSRGGIGGVAHFTQRCFAELEEENKLVKRVLWLISLFSQTRSREHGHSCCDEPDVLSPKEIGSTVCRERYA
jgi:hypothetical protein